MLQAWASQVDAELERRGLQAQLSAPIDVLRFALPGKNGGPSPQATFLAIDDIDIVIYGGSAGGGKTFAAILDPLKHVHVPNFGAVIFRRTMKQVKDEGGAWDASMEMYPQFTATPNMTERYWSFPCGAAVNFGGLKTEKDVTDWQGSAICGLYFEELTHFTARQFWYLFSRNRSTCGVKPYIRATTNPGPGWVKKLLAPWVDRTFPDPAKPGEVRYFIRENDQVVWVPEGTPYAKSMTFIRASLADNTVLTEKDPGYEANLRTLSEVDQQALLYGNWDVELPYRVLDGYTEARNLRMAFDVPKHWRRYLGIDFGKINGAELAIAEDPDKKVIVGHRSDGTPIERPVKVVYAENWPGLSRSTEKRVSDILELCDGTPFGGWGGNRTTEGDSRELLRSKGIPCAEPTVKEVTVQYQCVNDAFLSGELEIMETCPKLLGMIAGFQHKIGDDEKPLDEFDDTKFHLCAALRYPICMLCPPKRKRTFDIT